VIGEYGQPWTIDTAREEAQRLQGQVASGLDPAGDRDAAKASPTLEEEATRWIREHAEHHKAPSSVAGDKDMLARLKIAFVDRERTGPVCDLGRTRVDAITQGQMKALHLKLARTPTQANRALALLSSIFSFADRIGKDNPCRGVKRYRERKVERFLSDEELARLIEVLQEVEEEESEHPIILGCIVLLMLTGARPDELKTARREWLNEEAGTLRVMDPKEKKPKTLMLGPHGLAVVQNLPVRRGNPFLFPGRRSGEHVATLQKTWERIRERANLQDVRLYDLRHTYASKLAWDFNQSLPKIGKLLGHSSPATTERYVHFLHEPLRGVVHAMDAKFGELFKAAELKVKKEEME
jgi:integrase